MKRRLAALLLAWGLAGSGGAACAAELTPLERDGQRIYLEGASPSGARIGARVGAGDMAIDGAVLACGNCHGDDGRGRREGGIQPSDIRWSELTKSYGHQHDSGRRHGPFDERSLRRTLFDGVDPAGQRLDPAMPRYSMSERDFTALVAYLKKLEQLRDPGLGDDVLRIGTLLPVSGRLAEVGDAVRELLRSGFAAINERGGIHGRRLELVVRPWPEPGTGADLARWLKSAPGEARDDEVFALLAPLSAGIEGELAAVAAEARVPVIGPLTLFPEDRRASNPQIFHLLPGVPELALLLARHASRESGLAGKPMAVLHAEGAGSAAALAVREQLLADRWATVEVLELATGAEAAAAQAAALHARGVATVVVVGGAGDWPALARAADHQGWRPRWLMPGPLASREVTELPPAVAERLTLAYPAAPADRADAAVREMLALSKQPRHLAVQVSAQAASQLLVEALKRSGRELSRRRLLATLETVQGFRTGLLPPLSYNADRRIGAWGGYLVGIDSATRAMRPLGGYEALP